MCSFAALWGPSKEEKDIQIFRMPSHLYNEKWGGILLEVSGLLNKRISKLLSSILFFGGVRFGTGD
jgi:hypothetical protein